jgi:hypothetical protein
VGAAIHFSCPAKEGALLLLPQGGTRFDLGATDSLRDHAVKNARSWYRFVNAIPGLSIRNGSLYLVTGADKAVSWAVASYSNTTEQTNLKFTVADDTYDTQYVWEPSDSGVDGLGIGSKGLRTGPLRSQGPSKQNQCVFIRGYRLQLNDSQFAAVSLSLPPLASESSMPLVEGPGSSQAMDVAIAPNSDVAEVICPCC